jgi:uncharacterized protein
LSNDGMDTIQFDFRGHGDSLLSSEEMTLAGEIRDIEAVLDHFSGDQEIYLISASFGAVATCLMDVATKKRLSGLCLWNPVLSLENTFIYPELPWQLKNFGKDRLVQGVEAGRLLVDGSFSVGRCFIEELFGDEPHRRLTEFICPILIVHGDADSFVSFDIAACVARDVDAAFVSIEGGEHGLKRDGETAQLLRATHEFITNCTKNGRGA